MAKNLPARPAQIRQPATRAVYYVDPAPQALVFQSAAHQAVYLAAREREQRLQYARWRMRQAEIARRDRKVRRFLLGFGAVVGTGVLGTVAALVWFVFHWATVTGIGLLAVPLVVLVLIGLVAGGHRCVTVIQHWH